MTWSAPAGAPEPWGEEPAAEFAAIDTMQHDRQYEDWITGLSKLS